MMGRGRGRDSDLGYDYMIYPVSNVLFFFGILICEGGCLLLQGVETMCWLFILEFFRSLSHLLQETYYYYYFLICFFSVS
jgi:hypothetical protein